MEDGFRLRGPDVATEGGSTAGRKKAEVGSGAEDGRSKKRGERRREVCGGGPEGAAKSGKEAGGGKGVSVMFLNAQSLGNKMSELTYIYGLVADLSRQDFFG